MKYIGLAVGQSITKTATPINCIKAKNGIPNWEEIDKIIEKWKPAFLVVGIPLNMDGSMQQMSFNARKFGNRMHNRYKLKIEHADERLSTWEAKNNLKNQNITDFNKINSEAAAILLQRWLEESHQ